MCKTLNTKFYFGSLVAVALLLTTSFLMTSCKPQGEDDEATLSPYVSKVWEYCPAPGQFVNTLPVCNDGDSKEVVLQRANEALVGGVNKGMLCLGAWGGYVVVGFDHSIVNEPDTVDFKIYGNAYENNAEPGIVMVSVDENANGLPDDAWYELAGSEYLSNSTASCYRCVYYRPDSLNADILWIDNLGDSGYVHRNSYHTQAYYPLWESADSLVFEGARLPSTSYKEGSTYKSPAFSWGYADNVPNSSEKACFDIDWAVDSIGNSVKLSKIDFIKIYTAQQQSLGWIGETSTEITGVEDLHLAATL